MSWFLYYTGQLLSYLRLPDFGLLFLSACLLCRYLLVNRRKHLPPGPFNLPFLGYLPFLGRNFHLKLTQLSNYYGPVYQLFLGEKRVVVISDHNIVREAFRQPVFSGRPDTELTKLLKGYGIINSDGALWKEQRAFLHNVLREFGARSMGPKRDALEANIKNEVGKFLKDLKEMGNNPFAFRPIISRSVSSVVGSVLMSVTYSEKNEPFTRLLSLIDEGFRLLTISVPVNFIPALRFVPGCNYGYLKIKQNREETASYFLQIAKEHSRTLDASNIRDFVDAYLVQLRKMQLERKNTYFSDEQLVQVMGDIFSAGLETVTSVIDWAVLFLISYPDVQRKIQKQIDLVVGRERLPSLADLPNLPYVEATILEVLRRGNVLALGNAHAATEDAILNGYFIPKNTHVVPNLWAIHMNPQLWHEPEKFDPERFLVNGRVHKPDYFMPFSVGRRMCIGDTLTKIEVFLFLASLLHQFNLSIPNGEILPRMDGVISTTLTPRMFRVVVELRDKLLIDHCQ